MKSDCNSIMKSALLCNGADLSKGRKERREGSTTPDKKKRKKDRSRYGGGHL
jgi:hypothetical protein